MIVAVDAISGFYEKILERLTHRDNNSKLNNQPDFIVTLKLRLPGNKKLELSTWEYMRIWMLPPCSIVPQRSSIGL